MKETERIADQVRRAFEGDCWFGPGVRPIVEAVTEEQALARPLAGSHTICEIVQHMTAWKAAVVDWLAGSRREVSDAENFPAGTDWGAALEEMKEAQARLLAAIEGLEEARLEEPLSRHEYSVYFALHGVVQHDVYHAGQILMLKRAAESLASGRGAG